MVMVQLPSKAELLILNLLNELGESYGLALVKESGGLLKRGTVYVTLFRMEEKGYVTSSEEALTPDYIGIPRRLYKLTSLGRRALRAVRLVERVFRGVA